MQQKVQQKVHNNYAALLIKQFVFIKLVESLLIAWIVNWGCKLYFLLVWQNQNTKEIQFFNKCYCATRCALRCAVLCSVIKFVVQFYLRTRKNKIGIVIYRRVYFVMIHIFKSYILECTFSNFYILLCLLSIMFIRKWIKYWYR